MVEIRLKEVAKRFGPVTAVDSASFVALDNELLTLVGPSGCGKTTVLRLIAGFEEPDRGDILFDKKSVLTLSPEERNVGMVFQNYALFPHMNVDRNIAYGLKFSGMSKKEKNRKVRRLLQMVNLEGMEKRSPGELSAGQRQRVALVRALAVEPTLLLLDEPLSALDAKLRERLRLEIKQIQQELDITTIYVTHDQEEALIISDKIAVMNEGQIEQVGRPPELYNLPSTEFVARFIGRGNLVAGRVKELSNHRLLVEITPRQPLVAMELGESEGTYKVGDKVKFLIRPENMTLNGSLENELLASVESVEYLGDALRIHLNYDQEELIVKKSGVDHLLSKLHGKTKVSFSPKDCYLLPKKS